MKLTIPKPPGAAVVARSAVASPQQDFSRKLAALRAATGVAERFISLCACAVHDRAFTVVYERTDPRVPFVITGIYREDEGNAGARGSADAYRKSFSARDIDMSGWRGPHCASGGRNSACGKCGAPVCGGRTKSYHGMAPVFTCRASCGARGALEEVQSIDGIEPAARRWQAFGCAPVTGGSALPAPGSQALRLGPPARPRLK